FCTKCAAPAQLTTDNFCRDPDQGKTILFYNGEERIFAEKFLRVNAFRRDPVALSGSLCADLCYAPSYTGKPVTRLPPGRQKTESCDVRTLLQSARKTVRSHAKPPVSAPHGHAPGGF